MQVAIADDHALVRESLAAFLKSSQQDWDISEAATLPGLHELLQHGSYGLIIVDLNMPGMDGAASCLQIP